MYAPREGNGLSGAAGRRGRGGRDRGNREAVRPAVVEGGETPLFDEPVAPRPVEPSAVTEVAGEATQEEQGSRRWRGRRGRRRGRGGREGGSPLAAETESAVVGDAGEVGDDATEFADDLERLSLEGAAAQEQEPVEDQVLPGSIEIDLSAEPRAPEDGGAVPRRFERDRGRGGRNRGGSGRDDRGSRNDGRPRREDVRAPFTQEPTFHQLREEVQETGAEPAGEAVVLPGESIRKYRDPAEVAAEDAARRPAGGAGEMVVASAPAIEIVGWDGGAVLPGETLSRHRPREARAQAGRDDQRGGFRRDAGSDREEVRGSRAVEASAVEVSQPEPESAAEASVVEAMEARSSASLQPIELHAYALTPAATELVMEEPAEESIAPTPIADVEDIAAAAAPDETGGLTQHPAHADESAAVGPVLLPETAEAEPVEYEPGEGEAASLGDAGRRDYRRMRVDDPYIEAPRVEMLQVEAAQAEEPKADPAAAEEIGVGEVEVGEAEVGASSASEAFGQPVDDAELLAAVPDATTYDLREENAGESTPEMAAVTGMPLDLSREPVADEMQHRFTTVQDSGEMVAEPAFALIDDAAHLPPVQDADEPIFPHAAMQAQVLAEEIAGRFESGTRDADATEGMAEDSAIDTAEDTEEPMHDGTLVAEPGDAVPQVHAYGDGDLQEEEVDGDEYEYDVAVASTDEDEFEDYEEETLDGSDAIDSVMEEMSLEEGGEEDEEDPEYTVESAAGGFTVEDFGGEPSEPAEITPAQQNGSERRGRRDNGRDGRRSGNRDRRPGGGFRGGASAAAAGGGDRGRGRGRQSVQAMDLPAINELLKPGQEILVQIAKEPIAKKGARITSHIALPGRFLVFMPTVNHTGVSRKISSDEERRRLKTILLSEKGDVQGGFIVRTAADGASEEELRNDLRFLIQLWQDIKARSESSKSPALIYHDLSLIERILRDQVTDNFSAIWVDTEAEYERVLRFLQRFQPSLVRRVKLYTKETPLFEHFGVTQEIDKALKSKVWLKSGGSIVIDQTEALVAIDINTGKYVGKTARLEDTILKTNLDAIPEIVRQIRLRDLGGIIVIDFIDMDERKNRAKVMQVLEDELKSDRAPSKVLPFNDFGLVIMTRKRVKQSLERTLCIPDPITDGTGMIKSPITVANEIYIEMRKMQKQLEKTDVMLRVHPEVVKTLKANGGKRLQELEEMTRKTILVKSDPAINPEQFDIH